MPRGVCETVPWTHFSIPNAGWQWTMQVQCSITTSGVQAIAENKRANNVLRPRAHPTDMHCCKNVPSCTLQGGRRPMGMKEGPSESRSPPSIDSPTQRVRPLHPPCTSHYPFMLTPECDVSSMHTKARLGVPGTKHIGTPSLRPSLSPRTVFQYALSTGPIFEARPPFREHRLAPTDKFRGLAIVRDIVPYGPYRGFSASTPGLTDNVWMA